MLFRLLICVLSLLSVSCEREFNCACTAVHEEQGREILRKNSLVPIMAEDEVEAQADCSGANQDRMVYSVRVRINCEIVP